MKIKESDNLIRAAETLKTEYKKIEEEYIKTHPNYLTEKPLETDLKLVIDKIKNIKYKYRDCIPFNFSLAEWKEYRRVISKPMDFGTIKEKYKQHQYLVFNEFKEDIRLVFNNAFKFNKDKDNRHIVEAANRLSNKFETEVARYEGKPVIIHEFLPLNNNKKIPSSVLTHSTTKKKLSEKEKEVLMIKKTCEDCYNKIYNHEYIKMGGFNEPKYFSVFLIFHLIFCIEKIK